MLKTEIEAQLRKVFKLENELSCKFFKDAQITLFFDKEIQGGITQKENKQA